MHPDLLFSTTARIVRQLRHDIRTLAIVTVIPLIVLTFLHYLFDERQPLVSQLESQLLVVFCMMIMFLLTAIAMVRERISGTLERLLTTPIDKPDIIGGYAFAFGLLATWQACAATGFAYWVLGMQVAGELWQVLLAAIISSQLGVAFGLLSSAISRTEFQAVQMFPVLITPQMLLCGMFGPRDQMADWLYYLSVLMPMTYGVEAIDAVVNEADATRELLTNLGIVTACALVLLGLAAATLRRRTP